jgi:superfamily I DNA and RNA helicase
MKKNLILKFMVPALMLGVITTAFAADDQPSSNKTPEQRNEALKKQREEFKKLTPEERAAKRKEALAKREKRLAELQKKKADGAITEKEQKQLDRLEAMKNNQGKPNAQRPHGKGNSTKPAGEEKSQ